MENNELKKYVSEVFAQDIDVSLSIERGLIKKLENMEKLGLSRSQGYKQLVGIKTEQSYFTAYLYRLFDLLIVKDPSIIEGIDSDDMKIKRMIQVWKKTDVNKIRKMRKKIGDDGVNLMKNSINNSISKVNSYIEALGQRLKEL